MAYVLGFLFADGNIIKTKRGTHFTALYTSDYELLKSISKIMRSTHKISSGKSKTGYVYKIQIGSKELFDDLGELGLTPNKAQRMRLPKIPKKHFSHFVRGYFDGDGNVWMGLLNKNRLKPTLALTSCFTSASHEFLTELHRELLKKGLKGGGVYRIKNKECNRLSFSTLDTLKLYRIMYTMPYKLFLTRKKLIFEKFIKMRL